MRAADAALLGALHGPAELLPISSSGHVALVRALTGWEISKTDEVSFHTGALAALLVGLRGEARAALLARRVALHATALAPVALAVAVGRDAIEARLGGPRATAAGMLVGAAALALADRGTQERRRDAATWRDGLALGVAQAAALWPGISRNGATLAAARWRRFERGEANRLSREVGVPVLAGATAHELARGRRIGLPGAAAAFASTLVALPLLRLVDSGRPLWPFALYRAGVALALVGRSGR